MKNKSKFSFVGLFIIGLAVFPSGLLALARSMTYGGMKYNYMAENWIFHSTYLIGLAFAIGWWVGNFDEQLLLNNKRKVAIITFFVTLAVCGIISLSSGLVSGFASHIIEASGSMIFSGFAFRLSVIKPEVIAKIWEHDKKSMPFPFD